MSTWYKNSYKFRVDATFAKEKDTGGEVVAKTSLEAAIMYLNMLKASMPDCQFHSLQVGKPKRVEG